MTIPAKLHLIQKEKLLLIVKGSKKVARRAARKRGIRAHFINRTIRGQKEVTGYAPLSEELKLGHWFCEDIPGPFPVGTLLFYTLAVHKFNSRR